MDFINSIFDPFFYTNQFGDIESGGTPFSHFLTVGNQKGYSPSPLFDVNWYKHGRCENLSSVTDILEHYLKFGISECADPHPLFNVKFYIENTNCKPSENPILHYLETSKSQRKVCQSPSMYFDSDYYLSNNPDVAKENTDPFMHYLLFGWREYRNPNPYFNCKWYLSRNSDVAAANVEPLGHFIATGLYEGRQPHHLIDIEYYLAGAPDVAKAGVNPFFHYIHCGDLEGRSAHPLFNPGFYKANGLPIGDVGSFYHYAVYGVKMGRSPCPAFDPSHYAMHNPDIDCEPLLHYLLSPVNTRRHFHPLIDGEFQALNSINVRNGWDALLDYSQFRSHFDQMDLARGNTFIPSKPTKALIPEKSKPDALLKSQPLVSIVIPCYKSNPRYLELCVNSILAQTYKNWELILVEDGSPDDLTWPLVHSFAKLDARILCHKLTSNRGISGATNAGIEFAKGEYIALVDHDDVITNNALFEMMSHMTKYGSDAAYSDQAYVSSSNVVDDSFFKPDWSPILFCGVMYVGHLLIVKKAIAQKAGLFDSEYDGCQDFEFMLRVGEVTEKVHHVPKILYHWRRSEGSVASDSDAKGKIEPKQARAVNEHFRRINFLGVAEVNSKVPHRLTIVPKRIKEKHTIDIIIHGRISIEKLTVFVDSVADLGIKVGAKVVLDGGVSPLKAISECKSSYLLFIDSSIDFLVRNWIDYFLMYLSASDVAFVSSMVSDKNNRVISAGYVFSPQKGPLPAYKDYTVGSDGSAGTLICSREVSIVGASCTMVSRDKFEKLGGISRYCASMDGGIKLLSMAATIEGYRNIVISNKILELNQTKMNLLNDEFDKQLFVDNYSEDSVNDIYYNPNFRLDSADFR